MGQPRIVDASPQEADAMSRRGWRFRIAFAFLAAVVASFVTPLPWIALWLVLVVIWEAWLGQFLTDWLVWPLHGRDKRAAGQVQTAIVAVGALLYGAFPFLVWSSTTLIGAIMAVAWIGGTSIHVFVYLSGHRAQLIVGLAPPLTATLILPSLHLGVSLEAGAVTLSVLYLISAAAAFAFDRNALLTEMIAERSARQAAEAIAQAKTEFLNVVSHELRTPINHIIGYAGLLQDDLADGLAKPEDAEKIAIAGGDLLRMVNRVIRISHLEAGSITPDSYDTTVDDLLTTALRAIEPTAAASGNSVRLLESPHLALNVDGEMVIEALQCLLENAAKFCRDGVITISAKRIAADVEISVSDTGPGLSEEALRRIMQPMTQAEGGATRRYDGLGLGLTLCNGLAKTLGGSIRLESAPGSGTIAYLRFAARTPLQAEP